MRDLHRSGRLAILLTCLGCTTTPTPETAVVAAVNSEVSPSAAAHAYDDDLATAIAAMEALGNDASPHARYVLRDIMHAEGVPSARWDAAARSLVTIAEHALDRGDRELCGEIGHDLFLSSSPADVRRRAFAALVRGRRDESLRWVELVLDGKQDADYAENARMLLHELNTPAARELAARYPGD